MIIVNFATSTERKMAWEEKLTDLILEEVYLATGNKSKEHFSGDCNVNEILQFVKQLEAKSKKETAREIVKELQLGGWPETITLFRESEGADELASIYQITKAIINHYKI